MKRALVVTALEVETDAVLEQIGDTTAQLVQSGRYYHWGTLEGGRHTWQVATREVDQGQTNAAAETTAAIHEIRPDVVLLVGVAGGLKDVRLGDVVAATFVRGYERGKETDKGYLPRGEVVPSASMLVEVARVVARGSGWHERVPGRRRVPRALIKPIAAGEKVVASAEGPVRTFLRSQASDAVAVSMEDLGVLAAAHKAAKPAIVIRGISDLVAGKSRADAAGWQPRAARNASAFAVALLRELQFAPAEGPEPVPQSRPPRQLRPPPRLVDLQGAVLRRGPVMPSRSSYTARLDVEWALTRQLVRGVLVDEGGGSLGEQLAGVDEWVTAVARDCGLSITPRTWIEVDGAVGIPRSPADVLDHVRQLAGGEDEIRSGSRSVGVVLRSAGGSGTELASWLHALARLPGRTGFIVRIVAAERSAALLLGGRLHQALARDGVAADLAARLVDPAPHFAATLDGTGATETGVLAALCDEVRARSTVLGVDAGLPACAPPPGHDPLRLAALPDHDVGRLAVQDLAHQHVPVTGLLRAVRLVRPQYLGPMLAALAAAGDDEDERLAAFLVAAEVDADLDWWLEGCRVGGTPVPAPTRVPAQFGHGPVDALVAGLLRQGRAALLEPWRRRGGLSPQARCLLDLCAEEDCRAVPAATLAGHGSDVARLARRAGVVEALDGDFPTALQLNPDLWWLVRGQPLTAGMLEMLCGLPAHARAVVGLSDDGEAADPALEARIRDAVRLSRELSPLPVGAN